MSGSDIRIVTLADRPDLAPIIVSWIWDAFDRADGYTLEQTRDLVAASTLDRDIPRTFILLAGDEPVATASLTAEDAPERPDLTPWLASVFVPPDARGRGYATRVVKAVEAAAGDAGVKTLWLYTRSAERLYAGLGWHGVETFDRGGGEAVLMRRDI